MAIWGSNVVAVKFLIDYFPPLPAQTLRIFIGGLTLLLFLLFTRQLRGLNYREWMFLFAIGMFTVLGHHLFLTLGLIYTTASKASIILGLLPLATTILSVIFLGERLTWLRFSGIILGFVGITFVVFNEDTRLAGAGIGDFYIFLSMFTQAISFILIKKVTETVNSIQTTCYMLLIGVPFLYAASFVMPTEGAHGWGDSSLGVWLVLIISGVVATGISNVMYNKAMSRIGPSQSSLFTNLVPVFTLIGSAIALNEQILLQHVAGLCFVVIGVILGTGYMDEQFRKKRSHRLSS